MKKRSFARRAQAVVLAICTLLCLCSCRRGFAPGDVSGLTPESKEPDRPQTPEGSWFCPEELCGYVFGKPEDGIGSCVFFTRESPAGQKTEKSGSYTTDGDRIRIDVGGRSEEYRFLLDGGKMLILTDMSCNERIFTPERGE